MYMLIIYMNKQWHFFMKVLLLSFVHILPKNITDHYNHIYRLILNKSTYNIQI
jgi:hypothetical protein